MTTSPTAFDFDTLPDRDGTGSLKWDRYAGRDVLPMWVADMDFRSPPAVVEALRRRADHGVFGYTIPYRALEEEVTAYLKGRHGMAAEPSWLTWLPGLVPALNLACRAFAEPGEGVLTCTPVYAPFLSAPANSGRILQTARLTARADDGTWGFDWDALEDAVDATTRVFFLCNPHNPVGRVYRRDELEALGSFCERHDLVLVSDEIHSDLVLEAGLRHVPTATLGEAVSRRTVTLMSPSKTYNLPGLACAFAVISDPGLRQRFRRACRGVITEVNAFGYVGCLSAYRDGEPWRQALVSYLRGNRDLLAQAVRERLAPVTMAPIEATYLAWLDVRALGVERPMEVFLKHGVGLSNGVDFGMPGYLRINFGCPRSRLTEAIDRMAKAVRACAASVASGTSPA